MELRRRLYSRGSSFETTIPKPLLFKTEKGKSYDVVFRYDMPSEKWTVSIEERARSNSS